MATTFKKISYVNITTPAGIAVWPKLNAPDTKFNALGQFLTKLKLTGEQAQPLIDKYEAELAKFFESEKADLMAAGDGKSKAKAKALTLAKDKPYKPCFDDEGDETGEYEFNFKMPHKIVREGKPDLLLYPDIFDAAGKKLKNPPAIWGGSTLVIAAQLRPFNTNIGVGLSLRLQAVQIIELVQGGSKSAGGYGFGATTGGYEGGDDEDTFPAASADAAPAGSNDDF